MEPIDKFNKIVLKLKAYLLNLQEKPKSRDTSELIDLIKIYINIFEEAIAKNDTKNPVLLALYNQILNVLDEIVDE